MARKKAKTWSGEERRQEERRILERREFGRELTNAERAGDNRRRGDRRLMLDRRQSEIDEVHERM